jgi:hypothetical protein
MAEIPNFNSFTDEVILKLKDYITILIICICVFILINLITCCVVIFNRKSIKKIENKIRYI